MGCIINREMRFEFPRQGVPFHWLAQGELNYSIAQPMIAASLCSVAVFFQ
jgi:hypothetical protein